MKKGILWVLFAVCAAGLIFAGAKLGGILYSYHVTRALYEQTAEQVVSPRETAIAEESGGEIVEQEVVYPPIEVDFDELLAVNPDVTGWIYCEDTVINYPVVQGEDNTFYLHHSIDGAYSSSAAIFVDSYNQRDFQDANTIIYGHHMKNGSMFAGLEDWSDQSYYEEHPVMWLLTPAQNYRIVLFSGYHTAADSDAYRIYDRTGEALDTYIQERLELSDFQADIALSGEDKIVTLSTCAYVFTNARYVLHGILEPVG